MAADITFMVGGEAGQGVHSVGVLLAKAFACGGYYVFADPDYDSRVRGGHNFFRIRVKESPVDAISEKVDILLALNEESIILHRNELSREGVIVYDGDNINPSDDNKSLFGMPLEKLAAEKAGNKVMANTVALGAALGLVGYDIKIIARVLKEFFPKADIGDKNVVAVKAGYDYAQSNFKGEFKQRLAPISDKRRMLLNGNEAISIAAIAAGCKFMSAYPMTPSSSIMEYLAAKSNDMDLVMLHAEDEIAAVNMAIGASYAGVRAMTATSGSGFCLMSEGLGLAGITETPIVIIDAQRPGPAVGLPTRTEQADLEFVLHAHHGEFPRVVLAPASVEDCFWLTVKAFNLADKYQLPVIILTDQHLASCYVTVDKFDLSRVTIDRGSLYSPDGDDNGQYQRHKITASGISPRAFPGREGVLVVTDGDEHDETGHLTEDAGMRNEQMAKRLRKLDSLAAEMDEPRLSGDDAGMLLIGWGSSYGAIREAAEILKGEGGKIQILHLRELWPFPDAAVTAALDEAAKSYVIESNATGQLANLIKRQIGKTVTGKILRYDGRPLTPAWILREIKKRCC